MQIYMVHRRHELAGFSWSLSSCYCIGDRDAVEMNWMDVPGEKLLEPPVTLVSDTA